MLNVIHLTALHIVLDYKVCFMNTKYRLIQKLYDNSSKFVWLLTTEDLDIIEKLGNLLIHCFNLRTETMGT